MTSSEMSSPEWSQQPARAPPPFHVACLESSRVKVPSLGKQSGEIPVQEVATPGSLQHCAHQASSGKPEQMPPRRRSRHGLQNKGQPISSTSQRSSKVLPGPAGFGKPRHSLAWHEGCPVRTEPPGELYIYASAKARGCAISGLYAHWVESDDIPCREQIRLGGVQIIWSRRYIPLPQHKR